MPLNPEVTQLNPMEEASFQQWAKKNNLQDLNDPRAHYDYRGFWKENPNFSHAPGEHFTDKFKQHGHPSFSVESQYSKGPLDGGHWFMNTVYQPEIPRSSQHMDPLQQQLMMRAQQSPDAGAANAMAHPPLPGAPPASIGAPTPPGPGGPGGGQIDPGMLQKILAMLKSMSGGQGTGMIGPAAPMHGMPQQSGPQAGGNFMDSVANMPGMQRLKGIVGM